MYWLWITIRFQFWGRLAIWAKAGVGHTQRFQAWLEKRARHLEWKAISAHSPIYVRNRKLAGCKKGCQVDFPHVGRACYSHEDYLNHMTTIGWTFQNGAWGKWD